jgi:predicted DCC family thiol-disulfide oxidoreductase YuxK
MIQRCSLRDVAPHAATDLHKIASRKMPTSTPSPIFVAITSSRQTPARSTVRNVTVSAAAPEAPTTFRPGAEYFATDVRPIILYDGVCNLCNGGVQFMLDWDKQGRARFAALQSPAGRSLLQRSGRAPDDISSIVLVEPTAAYIKSEAILRIAKLLEMPFPLLAGLGMLVPLGLRDVMYDGVANNRYSFFGLSTECRMSDDRFYDRFVE